MIISVDQIKTRLLETYPDSRLEIVPPAEIDQIRKEYPGIPEDYLQYLEVVGAGRIGKMMFMVYSGPCSPSDIYDAETAESLRGIVLIGDDFSGDCVGYDANDKWQIGEVGSSCEFQPPYGGNTSFVEMLYDRFLTDT
jgi:hypothetical protein